MLPTKISESPSLGDFIPLSEYQSTTPETFHGGKPVLYYHATGAKAYLPADQTAQLPIFHADAPVAEGDAGDMVAEDDIQLFVNSETLTIFNPKTSTGMQIPYTSIALHAMQHKTEPQSSGASQGANGAHKAPCVLLQLDLSDGGADDETFDTVQLTLVPPSTSTNLSSPVQEGPTPRSEQEKLFDAITACQNLHPDPVDEDDEDEEDDYADRIVLETSVEESAEGVDGLPGVFRGSTTGDLPPPMPGSSGWITAENVGEYFDADGNWIGGHDQNGDAELDDLGEGAGRVRARHEINGHDGAEEDAADSKRPRTE